MKGLTTMASMPSGGGCQSALSAETVVSGPGFTAEDVECANAESTGFYSFEEGGLVRIGDVVTTPADKHGFEPFEYTERN